MLALTWAAGDSQEEKFETVRGYYVASHEARKRPGKILQGFQKALSRVPMRQLKALAAGVRHQIRLRFAERLLVDGFEPMGCDGSRIECPRSAELEARLRQAGKDDSAPTVWVLPRQESFASLHILTRRASEGSEALPSLARRVRMSFFGARVIFSTPDPIPRAVPWAFCFGPFGAAEKRNTKTCEERVGGVRAAVHAMHLNTALVRKAVRGMPATCAAAPDDSRPIS